jgi:hypothetical protein
MKKEIEIKPEKKRKYKKFAMKKVLIEENGKKIFVVRREKINQV